MKKNLRSFLGGIEDKKKKSSEIYWPLENTFASFVKVGFAVLMGHSVFSERGAGQFSDTWQKKRK